MLYEIYTAIMAQLEAADTTNQLKGIEWYNVQYESIIANTPRVFIEFPDAVPFSQVSKDMRRAQLKVRLHVVTQAMPDASGVIKDTTAQAHEATAAMVHNAVDGQLRGSASMLNNLQLTG